MSVITWPTTGHWGLSKPLQYIEEGTTPATYGVTPTSSPAFVLAGAIQELSKTPSVESIKKRVIGLRKYYKNILSRTRNTFEIKFAPINSTLLKYGSEDPVGTGTNAASLSFAVIQKLNNTGTLADSFQFLKGCRCNTLDISIAGGEVECTMGFIAREITTPVFTANGGLTTPTWKNFSDLTATPWTHVDGGSNPLTINSVAYPVKAFQIQWNNNINPDDLNGSQFIDNADIANKDVSGSFTVLVGKDLALETDMRAVPLAERTASYVLKSSVSTINMTNLALKQASEPLKSDDNMSYYITYNFEASDATIT